MTDLSLIDPPNADADGVGINEKNLWLPALWLGDCLVDGAFFSSFFSLDMQPMWWRELDRFLMNHQ